MPLNSQKKAVFALIHPEISAEIFYCRFVDVMSSISHLRIEAAEHD